MNFDAYVQLSTDLNFIQLKTKFKLSEVFKKFLHRTSASMKNVKAVRNTPKLWIMSIEKRVNFRYFEIFLYVTYFLATYCFANFDQFP